MKRLLLIMVCIGLGMLAGCKGKEEPVKSEKPVSTEEVKKEAKEAVETATTFTRQQMDEYQNQIEARLKGFDQKLEELKVRAEKMEKDAKAEVGQQMNEIRKKRDVAAKKLEELRSASGKAWSDLKAGLDAALEDVEKAYQEALSRFK
jgi:TolA-binding protein